MSQPMSVQQVGSPISDSPSNPEWLYLDLLKKCLSRYIFGEGYASAEPPIGNRKRLIYQIAHKLLTQRGLELVRRAPFDPVARAEGRDRPLAAETMIGLRRLENIQFCVTNVLRHGVPGDLIETGVWRGGATIFMRGILKAYGDTQRIVWVADSFQGLPKPNAEGYPADAGDRLWRWTELAVSVDEVKENFRRYDLLDDQVRFLIGWFRDTLPNAPIDRLAVLRLDGDMYESTMDALRALYPKLSVGGYLIIDDFNLPACRAAVNDFRNECRITEDIERIDSCGVYWHRLR